MNQCDESASVLSTQQFRHHVCPSFSTMLALWCDTLISLAYPPPTHPHTHIHTHSFPSMPCVTVCLGTEQQPCGEMKVKTSHWPLTHLTRFWHCDNWMTILLIWLSLQYMKRIFSWWGKKRTPCKIIRCQVRGAKWKQRPVTAVIFTSDVCWKEFMLTLHYNLHKCHTRCCAWQQNKNSKLSVWI